MHAGSLGSEEQSLLDTIASPPASSYASPLDAAAQLLTTLDRQVDTLCTVLHFVCPLSTHCAEPAAIAVHGRGFTLDAPADLLCRAGNPPAVETVTGTLIDNRTVRCDFGTPVVPDPTAGARINVSISLDGGEHYTAIKK